MLLEAIEDNEFDAVFGGARRDEEKARARSGVFSFRDEFGQWDPRTSGPSCGASTTAATTGASTSGCSPSEQLDRARHLAVHRARAA